MTRTITAGTTILCIGVLLILVGTSSGVSITADRSTQIPVADTPESGLLGVTTEASTPSERTQIAAGTAHPVQSLQNRLSTPITINSYSVEIVSGSEAITIVENPHGTTLGPGQATELQIGCNQPEHDAQIRISNIEAAGGDVSIALAEDYDLYLRCTTNE